MRTLSGLHQVVGGRESPLRVADSPSGVSPQVAVPPEAALCTLLHLLKFQCFDPLGRAARKKQQALGTAESVAIETVSALFEATLSATQETDLPFCREAAAQSSDEEVAADDSLDFQKGDKGRRSAESLKAQLDLHLPVSHVIRCNSLLPRSPKVVFENSQTLNQRQTQPSC